MIAPTSLTAVPGDAGADGLADVPGDSTAGNRAAAYPSDAPLRQRGTRTRSGNAMERTRTAILAAALRCLEADGVRKTTMGDVSVATGIAKATLYNHFRTKPDLLAALVDDQVAMLAAACTALASEGQTSVGQTSVGQTSVGQTSVGQAAEAGGGGGRLDAALTHAGRTIADSAALRRLAAEEPALLLPLLVPGPGRAWLQSRAAVGDVLLAAGLPAAPQAVEAVLRWLVGQLLWPMEPALLAPSAALLSAGVRSVPTYATEAQGPAPARPTEVQGPAPARPTEVQGPAEARPVPGPTSAVGWPG